jgi:hypothetical protein
MPTIEWKGEPFPTNGEFYTEPPLELGSLVQTTKDVFVWTGVGVTDPNAFPFRVEMGTKGIILAKDEHSASFLNNERVMFEGVVGYVPRRFLVLL